MGKEVQQQVALNLLSEGTSIEGDLHAKNVFVRPQRGRQNHVDPGPQRRKNQIR